jgi:hypothetical protein
MAQQGKRVRVGAREGFAYQSVKLVVRANSSRYEVDSNRFFFSFKWLSFLFILEYYHVPTLTFFDTFVSVVCGWNPESMNRVHFTIHNHGQGSQISSDSNSREANKKARNIARVSYNWRALRVYSDDVQIAVCPSNEKKRLITYVVDNEEELDFRASGYDFYF